MMLKPDTPESRLLVDWVEGGKFVPVVAVSVLGLYAVFQQDVHKLQ